MGKAIVPALISTGIFILVALSVAYSGLGYEFERLFLGGFKDNNLLIFMLVVAYIPAFFAGVLAPLFERGWRASIKTAFIASVISLVLGVIISILIGVSLGLDGIYGFVIWLSITAPLYFGVSLVSIMIGYVILLVFILLNR